MPQIINTNIASLNAQRNLDRSQNDANVAFQRLSSGMRINSAKDDAAGLAISTRFQSQISGLNVAQRNANDGISLAQTAEGALDEVVNNLQRIRELAIQSANATNSTSDRQALNNEVQQRIEEIQRISEQTSFNGIKVLDGSFNIQTFQVGANSGDTIDVNLTRGAQADQIGIMAEQKLQIGDTTTGGTFTIAIGDGEPSTIIVKDGASNSDIAKAVSSAGVGGVLNVAAVNEHEVNIDDVGAVGTGNTLNISITDAEGNVVNVLDSADNGSATKQEIESAINKVSGETGVTADLNEAGDKLTLKSADGETYSIKAVITTTTGGAEAVVANFLNSTASVPQVGQVEVRATDDITIAGTESALVGGPDTYAVDETKSLANVRIDTVEGANDAINRVDAALTGINDIRSELGAVQNRFESTIANLSTTSENLSAANSRIRDADFAKETAELSRTQVLQQAGMSVLSQANAQPQNVLQLLQG